MKAVTDTFGVARSNVLESLAGGRRTRGPQNREGDEALAAEIRALIDQIPSYGYRRITALNRRARRTARSEAVNAKRVYRLMKKNGLLLERHTGHRRPRKHEGRVAVASSNMRWCSDGVELTCWKWEVIRVAFVLDCHDRESIAWDATTAGISGETICDLMIQCVEARFGTFRAR